MYHPLKNRPTARFRIELVKTGRRELDSFAAVSRNCLRTLRTIVGTAVDIVMKDMETVFAEG